MINILNEALKKEDKKGEKSFLSPDWKVTSQSGKNIVDVLQNIDEKTEVLRVEPQNLILVSITRRNRDGIKTVSINPLEVDPEEIITSNLSLDEEVMCKDDLLKVGVDESTLTEAFEEGHFLMSLQDDCLLIPCKGFTALIGKKLKAGKMPAGLNLARDLYLASLMGMGSTPVTIVTRGDKSTGTLKAVAAFGEQYPFVYQMDTFKSLKGGLEQLFGQMTEKSWCVTHQFTSITWAVCSCGDVTLGVCAQWSQTGYASTQLFPVAIYATGETEKIGPEVTRINSGSAVAADPEFQKLVAAFGTIWKEVIPLRDALARGKEIPVSSFKDEIEKASNLITIRDGFNAKKADKFRSAFKDVPDNPGTVYDVLMHIMYAPVLMHRLFSGTYEMVPNVASAALAVAESKGVL